MYILQCMGSKLCVQFQRALLKFYKNFVPIYYKMWILLTLFLGVIYNIFELWLHES